MLTNALSHERLTPLNSIINLSTLILNDAGVIGESVCEKVKVIHGSAEVLYKSTKSQLNHLAINSNKYEFIATKHPLPNHSFKDYLNQILHYCTTSLKLKDLTLNFEINLGDSDENIYTDYKIYEDILFHIVQNAIKFAKSRTQVLIKVDYKSEEHQKIYTGYLKTKVIDEGLSFNMESHTFDTFALSKSGLE